VIVDRVPDEHPKAKTMSKVLALFALLVGLAACHAGIGIGDNGQHPTYVATDPLGSAIAQASIGMVAANGN
jgi:hypothetical protein